MSIMCLISNDDTLPADRQQTRMNDEVKGRWWVWWVDGVLVRLFLCLFVG
jgi:hypothetical protein